MSQCDLFVFLDDVEITKSGYTRRVKVRHQTHLDSYRWLTVPLQKHSDFALINELIIDHDQPWTNKHYEVLRQTYQKSDNWSSLEPLIHEVFQISNANTSLSELNIQLIQLIADYLNIECEFVKSSELNVNGKSDTYTYRIAKHLGADTYIRGIGEERYASDPAWSTDSEIQLEQVRYDQFREADKIGTWINGYSIIDLIMHHQGSIFTPTEEH